MNFCDENKGPIETTMRGLQKWSKSKFKKLGWMFLAMHKHNLVKNVQQYHCSLLRLQDSIIAKRDITVDDYKKDDLKIKLEDIGYLINFCSKNIMTKDFNLTAMNPLEISTIDSRFPLDPIDITTCDLEGWYKCSFTKLGWMMLAKHKYRFLGKIDHYSYGLIILAKSIKMKHDKLIKYGEIDKVKDFKIMLENIIMLFNFVNATLVQDSSMSGGRKIISKKRMSTKRMSTKRMSTKRMSKKMSKKTMLNKPVKKTSRKTSRKVKKPSRK